MKKQNIIREITIFLILAMVVPNLLANNWSDWIPTRDSFTGWITGKPHWLNSIASQWTNLTPAQRNIALAAGGALLLSGGSAYAYNRYTQNKADEERVRAEQRAREDAERRLQPFEQRANQQLTAEEIRSLQKEITAAFPYDKNNPELEVKVTRLLDDLTKKRKEIEKKLEHQQLLAESLKALQKSEEATKEIIASYQQPPLAKQSVNRLVASYQKNIELIKKEPWQNQKAKFQSILTLLNFENKLTPQEKADIKNDILSALEPIEQKEFELVHNVLSDVETFFVELESENFALEKEDAQQLTEDLYRAEQIINTSAFPSKEKEALHSRLVTLKEKLARALEPEQLEAELEKKTKEEREKSELEKQRALRKQLLDEYEKSKIAYGSSVARGKQIEAAKMKRFPGYRSSQRSEAQVLQEKREGKQKESTNSSSSSSRPLISNQKE